MRNLPLKTLSERAVDSPAKGLRGSTALWHQNTELLAVEMPRLSRAQAAFTFVFKFPNAKQSIRTLFLAPTFNAAVRCLSNAILFLFFFLRGLV